MSLPSIPDPAVLRRGRRGMLLLMLVLSTFGACGLTGSVGALSAPPPALDSSVEQAAGDGEAASRALVEAFWEAPARKALAVANLLLSVLLLVASGSWALLRASAPWWTRQAVAANALWTVADAGQQLWVLHEGRDVLLPLLEAELRAQLGEQAAQQPVHGEYVLIGYALLALLWGGLRLGAYAWAWRRAHAEEVLAALRAFRGLRG